MGCMAVVRVWVIVEVYLLNLIGYVICYSCYVIDQFEKLCASFRKWFILIFYKLQVLTAVVMLVECTLLALAITCLVVVMYVHFSDNFLIQGLCRII